MLTALRLWMYLLCVAMLTVAAQAASLQESYEARAWTYADTLQVSVAGFDTIIKEQGNASLKLNFNCADPGNWGIVYTTPDFPLESNTPLTTGYSMQVYLEPVGGATGQPTFKLALQGASEMAGGDVALTSNTWTTVTIPAASVTGTYRQVKFIIGSNSGSASGQFNIYVDSFKRDDVLIDGFEPGFAGAVALVNIEATASGAPSDVAHLATAPVAAGPSDGAMAFAAQWIGDTNNVIEVQHIFATAQDLSAFKSLSFDIYVPAGTGLPTVGAFLWDGSNGFGTVGAVSPTANDAWQTLTIDVSSLGTAAAPFVATAVQELKLVLSNVSADGNVYLDNVTLSTEEGQEPPALPMDAILESYEARGWTYADSLKVKVTGFDTAFKSDGRSSLKLDYDCADPTYWGIVYTTPDFPLESNAPLTTGYSLQVYLEPLDGATGQPTFKLAVQGSTEMAGGDVALTSNTWTTVTIPAASVTATYRQVKFIIGSNSGNASGKFNIYVDSFKRDDVLIDGFEPGFAGSVALVNTEGTASGAPSDVVHLATAPVAAGPTEGVMAFAAQWTGDTNSVVEVQHNFSTPQDLTGSSSVTFDLYVPAGTALPTVGAFFWDGANGFGPLGEVAPTANDAWQTLTIDISSLATAEAPFVATAVQELKLVMSNVGEAGNIYLDNVLISIPGTPNAAKSWTLY